MTNNLTAEIEKILELDKNRTQGEWKCGEHLDGYNFSARTRDAQFIAAAPLMVEIIKALQAENERLKNAALAYQQLSTCYRIGKRPSEKLHKSLELAKQALSTPSDGTK